VVDDSYDRVAAAYDGHFDRPVDTWEDDRLAGLLAPMVNERRVLDLGCGTGWLLDHLEPAAYLGVDMSAAMLAELVRKHPWAEVCKAEVGARGWTGELPYVRVETVTATWSAEYFVDLPDLLMRLRTIVQPGGLIALHGCQPRGSRRGHFIDPSLAHRGPPFKPHPVAVAARAAGLAHPVSLGIGALPDSLARSRRLWRTALHLPVHWHYSALHVWAVP
jgi:SAM-dependent methyltransferase